jgi:hypothetical protein
MMKDGKKFTLRVQGSGCNPLKEILSEKKT